MRMLLFAVLINAAHAALEDREVAFDRVRVNVTANVFFGAVLDVSCDANSAPTFV
jgi:hypothetical protein